MLGLREVLDDPARVRRDWQRSSFEAVVRAFYDAIWVYGDPRVYDPVEEYGMPEDLAARVRYSGYIDRRRGRPLTAVEATAQRAALDLPAGPIALAMAGGGEDGFQLLEAFARSRMPEGATGLVVTGPMMPDAQREALEALAEDRQDLRLVPFIQDGDQLIRLADRVVCMAGYNTTCEVLASGSRALLVPRVHPRVEQLIRAERLSELGAVDFLHPARPVARRRVGVADDAARPRRAADSSDGPGRPAPPARPDGRCPAPPDLSPPSRRARVSPSPSDRAAVRPWGTGP